MKCPDCDEEMTKTQNVPEQVLSFTIPFFRHIEIRVWKWIDEPYCYECQIDRSQSGERAAWEAGAAYGAEQAIKELEIYGR